jgi:membrane fusion protein, multidrug efflux system
MHPCAVRLTEGDQAVIASGVGSGDEVVTDGVDRLQQGTKVQAQLGGGRGAGGRGGAGTPTNPAPPQTPSGQAVQPGGGRVR